MASGSATRASSESDRGCSGEGPTAMAERLKEASEALWACIRDARRKGESVVTMTFETATKAATLLEAPPAPLMSEENVERVARAIYESSGKTTADSRGTWESVGAASQYNFREHARAAISAISTDGVSAGLEPSASCAHLSAPKGE